MTLWPFNTRTRSSLSLEDRVLIWIKGRGETWRGDIADGLRENIIHVHSALVTLEIDKRVSVCRRRSDNGCWVAFYSVKE